MIVSIKAIVTHTKIRLDGSPMKGLKVIDINAAMVISGTKSEQLSSSVIRAYVKSA
jgi:hypothetical protein